jgi:hypothetical protein
VQKTARATYKIFRIDIVHAFCDEAFRV